MKLYDLCNYVFRIMKEEMRQIKRIVLFLLISAVLVFGLSVLSDTLREKLTVHFHHRYTLIPTFRISQEFVPPLSYRLLPHTINDIDFHHSMGLIQFEVSNLTQQSIQLLTLDQHDSSALSLRADLFETLHWEKGDLICMGTSCFPIESHHSGGMDLMLPVDTIQIELLPFFYDNILTVYSENIDDDLKVINQALMRADIVYTIETLRLDQLVLSLVTGMQVGLSVILAIIFLVTCTNINTVFPLFIVNFKDELLLLRYFGMPLKHVSLIFKVLALIMICGSILGAWFIVWFLSITLKLLFNLSTSYSMISFMLTAFFLVSCSSFSVFRYITKIIHEFTL